MKRREQNQPPEDPNQLNTTFLIKFTKINYERNPIDTIMLQTFTNLLDYVSDKIFKQPEVFTQKFLKPIIDIIIIVQYNLAQQYNKHTTDIQSLLNFFQSVFQFSQKMFLFNLKESKEKMMHGINIFWPLFSSKQKEPNISNLQNQIKQIKNVPPIFELQAKTGRFNTQNVLIDLIGNFTLPKQNTFGNLFTIFLTSYNEINRNFIQSILSFFEQTMNKNKTAQFEKCVKLLANVTNNMGDRYNYIQIYMNRILKSKQVVKNFVNAIKTGVIRIQKFYTDDKLLGLSLIILQHIMNQKFYDSHIIEAMRIISKLSFNFTNIQNYSDSKLQSLPIKFIQSLTKKKNFNPTSSLSRIFDSNLQQRGSIDFEGQGGSLDQKMLLQYIKSVKNNQDIIQENTEPQDNAKKEFIQKLCIQAKIILNNICSNAHFKNQVKINTIQSIQEIKLITSEPIKNLIISVFPQILHVNFKILIGCDCSLFNTLAIKKAQQMSVTQLMEEFDFKQFYHEIVSENCLNFHFLMGMIFLKKLKGKQDEKQQYTHFLIRMTLGWLAEKDLNDLTIIMNLLMILQCADIKISSIQLKLKLFSKNYSLLGKTFTVNDFVELNPRESTVGNFVRTALIPPGLKDLVKEINLKCLGLQPQKLSSNILMYLIIQFNNIAQKANPHHQLPKFISQINFMKRNNNVNNFNILSLSFGEYLSKPESEKSPIITIHYLVKLLMILQSNNFRQEGIRMVQLTLKNVKNYLQKVNSEINFDSLVMLNDKKRLSLYDSNYKHFLQLSRQSQIIKFYSQSKEEGLFLNVTISQQCMTIIKALLDVQKSYFSSKKQSQKIQQEGNQQQLPEGQTFTQMDIPLKKLNLLYFPYQYDAKLSSMSKVMVQMAVLQESSQDYKCNQIIQNLLKESNIVAQVILKQENLQQLWNFGFKKKKNTSQFIFSSIMRCFSAGNLKDDQIFNLACKVLQHSEVQVYAEKQIGAIFNSSLSKLIQQRIKSGLSLQTVQQMKSHLQTSSKLYKLVNKIVKVNINQEQIVQIVINQDKVDDFDTSSYILKQLLNVSLLIKTKTQKITQDIFSYIMLLNENYPQDKGQLQIPIFICSFFNLSSSGSSQSQLKNLEKNQKTNTCTNTPTYKCLKCDDKKIICYGCWMACHQGHPVIYVSDVRPNRCQCKDISLTIPAFKCSHAKKVEMIPPPSINNNNGGSIYHQPPPIRNVGSRQAPQNIFSYVGRPGERQQRGMRAGQRVQRGVQRRMYTGRRQQFDQGMGLLGGPEMIDFQDEQGDDFGRRFITRIIKNQSRDNERDQIQKRFTSIKYQKIGHDEFDARNDHVKGKKQKVNEQNFSFQQQNYESQSLQIEQQKIEEASVIASQSYLLPIFLQMFTDVANSQKQVTIQKRNFDYENIMFQTMIPDKILNSVWKATNPGNYNVRLRRQNHLQSKSPSISKCLIAQNPKFILIASGPMISTHLKQRFLASLLQGKNLTTFPNINQLSLTFDIHTIDFSPLDPFTFCVVGLHNINLLTINGEGQISKTNHRFNINNEYINKVRMSKLGIFLSTSNQIKLLNFACKPILSIKSSSQCLLKEWTVYERANDCIIYCVTSNGHTEFIEVSASDQGKKVFTSKVIDSRKKIDTGASILVKDSQQAGKMMIASFKDGSNIIGRMQGDTLQNISNFNIKTNHTDVFGKKIIMGHLQIVKGAEKQLFVIATVKQLLNNQNTIHQGQLTVFKIRADGKCSFQLVNVDNRCEHFIVVPAQDKNWAIISVHDDGSLHFAVLNKPNKAGIQAQCKKIRQIKPSSDQKSSQKNEIIRAEIKRVIKPQLLKALQLTPINFFRQFSDPLKVNVDLKVIKLPNNEYEIKMQNSPKILTGFCLQFLGNVILPNRTVKNTVEVGLSNLQILYIFAQGSLKFKVQKVEDVKIAKDSLNQKFMQKLQKLERLQKLQKLNQLSIDGERASQLINSIKQADLITQQISYYGLPFDIFKSRIHKFNQIFLGQELSSKNDQKLQKIALILTIFIKDSIQKQNYLCESSQIVDFARSIRKLSLSANQKNFQILKNLMVMALKMYEDMNGIKLHVFNEDLHPLKFATQDKMEYYYSLLKSEISDSQIQEITNFLISICDQNRNLLILYLAKYPSLLPKLQKKCKKIESQKINGDLLVLYIIGFQVLKFKNHSCEWILPVISTIIGNFVKSKNIRKKLYLSLKNYYNLSLDGWVKNVNEIDGQENIKDVNLVPNIQPRQQDFGGGQMNMMNYQLGMGEMDEEAMLRMALQMSQMDYKRQQEQNFNFQNENIQEPIQEQKQNEPEQELIMEEELYATIKTNPLLTDLIDEISKDLSEPADVIIPKIVTLYVVGKFIIETDDAELFALIIKALRKFLQLLTPTGTNFDKHITMSYFSVFNRLFITGQAIIKKSQICSQLYKQVKNDVMEKLSKLPIQNVTKMTTVPCLLGRILKGERPFTFSHYAYGLTSLLLPPCQPNHILLSLECYWLLPQSKQFYAKMKYKSTILDCMSGGNVKKMHQVAIQHPEIWKQCAEIQWVQKWIDQKKSDWDVALKLLTLYYSQN